MEASGPGSVAIGGDSNAPITTTVFQHVVGHPATAGPYPPSVHLSPWPAPGPVTVAEVTARPGLLLRTQHEVIPFTGRTQVVAELEAWLDDLPDTAVHLLHASGGAGKTRLAGEIARRSSAGGWQAWRADPGPATDTWGTVAERDAGLLVVVDYADRWPVARLVELVRSLQAVGQAAGRRVRVLALARTSGFWWTTLSERLASADGILTTEALLGSIDGADGQVTRAELFRAARDRYGLLLGVRDVESISPPADLGSPAYAQILAVHMAALVAVDALGSGAAVSANPAAVSAHLINRERAYWHSLHTRANEPMATAAQTMARAVCVATLVQRQPYLDGMAALRSALVVGSEDAASQVLADHAECYPPLTDDVVLEPLYPDRLGEDLVALSAPGHRVPGYRADPWAMSAIAGLLRSSGDGERPPWTAAVMTVLVETAHRWAHVASSVLDPMLQADPGLALAAGSAVLSRIADTDAVSIEVLDRVEAVLPASGGTVLDVAAAAITSRLTRHRLSETDDLEIRARLQHTLAWRLAHAGQRHGAAAAATDAVQCYQALVAGGATLDREWAAALTNLSWILAGKGQLAAAGAAAEQAVVRYNDLLATDRSVAADLALALVNRASVAWEADEIATMREAASRAVALCRELARPDESVTAYLAAAINNLALAASAEGDADAALELAGQSEQAYRALVDAGAGAYLPRLAQAANLVAVLLWEAGRYAPGLSASDRGLAALSALPGPHPDPLVVDRARILINRALCLSGLERHEDAAETTEETLAALGHDLGAPTSAVPSDRVDIVAHVLNTHASMLVAAGRRLSESLRAVEAAIALCERSTTRSTRQTQAVLDDSLRTRDEIIATLGCR